MLYSPNSLLRRLINAHDSERLLFGSDYPLYDPLDALHSLQARSGLDDARMERLLHNADKLLAPVPNPTKDNAHAISVSWRCPQPARHAGILQQPA